MSIILDSRVLYFKQKVIKLSNMTPSKDQSMLIECSKKRLEQMLLKTKEELHLLDVN